jgi:hypothetical protein
MPSPSFLPKRMLAQFWRNKFMANENKQNSKLCRSQPLFSSTNIRDCSENHKVNKIPNPSQFDSDLVPNCFCTLLILGTEKGHMSSARNTIMQFFCSSSAWQVVWKNVIELPIVTIAVSPVQNAINLKTCVKVSTEHLQLPNDKIHLTVNGHGSEVNLFVFFCRKKILQSFH